MLLWEYCFIIHKELLFRFLQQTEKKGLYAETINCSNLFAGIYILNFEVNGINVGAVIIKQ